MCGILFQITKPSSEDVINSSVLRCIKKRGPDESGNLEIRVDERLNITFFASVLWMQGNECTPQPVNGKNGVLLFNGDIFNEDWKCDVSDTEQISKIFEDILENQQSVDKIVEEIKKFKGPFSLIYYCKNSDDIIVARDRIGRNSLLFAKANDTIVISSVLDRSIECFEIPASNIIKINLHSDEIMLYSWTSYEISRYLLNEWHQTQLKLQNQPDEDFLFELKNELDEKEMVEITSFIESSISKTSELNEIMELLLQNEKMSGVLSNITSLLEKSVRIRLERQPNKCKNCLFSSTNCSHCAVGVLFSGGLDCTILAYLADKCLPEHQSVELLNVAFNKDNSSNYNVPDRLTGLQSLEELKKLCPLRQWVFKELNVSKDELKGFQKSVIADLVYPRQTILDESLGSALWFASRGQDKKSDSTCRVLLLGSGADELFGGYSRHRNSFKRQGWRGLNKELHLDWQRISFRNLARDNRVICDHGRQPRMPYLDEEFAHYVLNLDPWLKCYFSEKLSPEIGSKLMLRLVAFKLGLTQVAFFRKRALQFGSRIANKKEKGNDISINMSSTKK